MSSINKVITVDRGTESKWNIERTRDFTFDSKNYSILLALIWVLTYWAFFSSISSYFRPFGKLIASQYFAVQISTQQEKTEGKNLYIMYLKYERMPADCPVRIYYISFSLLLLLKSHSRKASRYETHSLKTDSFIFTFVLMVFYLLWTIQWLFYESLSLSKEDWRKDEKTEIDTPAQISSTRDREMGGAGEWMKMRKRQK